VTAAVLNAGLARSWLRAVAILGIGASLCTLLLMRTREITRIEAAFTGSVFEAVGLTPARAVGAAVIFPLDDYYAGFLITPGCSIIYPTLIPLVAVLGMMVVGRVNLVRGLIIGAASIGLLIVVNQVRMATVVLSMRAWGFELGYERSHVLFGSTISTLGMVGVAIIFALMLMRVYKPRHRRKG
jgi:exosortase/archaeosortase family protein